MATRQPEAKESVVPIYVSEHARMRARARFPGFKAARIRDEVRGAIKAGNISATKPSGISGKSHPDCLYVWNDERCYPLKEMPGGDAFYVMSTIERV